MNALLHPLAAAAADLVRRMEAGLAPEGDAEIAALACGETVRAIERGDVCLPLGRLAGRSLAELRREEAAEGGGAARENVEEDEGGFRFPAEDALRAALRAATDAVRDVSAPDGKESAPFVLEGDRLYTRRNHRCERKIRARLDAMATATAARLPAAAEAAAGAEGLNGEQRAAAELLLSRRFAILTGGPGTGKTFTLAHAVRMALAAEPDLRIGLAAPTGKAAARMTESMAELRAKLPADDPAAGRMPSEAYTIQRLIGQNPATGGFRHDRNNPLPLDWLVVDEASMVDLLLFGHLLDALPEEARLLLIGDPRQLASVERGHILRDLCEARAEGDPGRLRYAVARLERSRRFAEDGAIARFAAAVNAGDGDGAVAQLRAGDGALVWTASGPEATDGPEAWPGFRAAAEEGYGGAVAAVAGEPPEEIARRALERLGRFRILCVVRRGPFGVDAVNACMKKWLPPDAPVPVMVTRNDASLGVNNGDLGVVLANDPAHVWVGGARGTAPRRIPRLLLPELETAWASTVHKSQGSEYGDVAVVLPGDARCPLLTREVLYTAVTRTKRGVRLWASEEAVRVCTARRVERVSGFAV